VKHDAILFDFDGVLADTEPLHFACWRDVAAPLGLEIEWPWYRDCAIGIADNEMVSLVCQQNNRADLVPSLWHLFDEKKRLFSERIAEDLPMPAEVAALLAGLSLPLAVVSTSFRSEVEPALIAAGVRNYFAATVFGDDVARLKPHPEPYLTAARLLRAERPLVVEDSDTGAAAGLAAGFRVIRVQSAGQTPAAVRQALQT
jgi:beta-phosphoglucomutase